MNIVQAYVAAHFNIEARHTHTELNTHVHYIDTTFTVIFVECYQFQHTYTWSGL